MSTIERKEYQETKIMRTVSPVRNIRSSNQNLVEFDHNLDYLLEDLQNSVSRPGSSLGTHRETSKALESTRSNSLNRFTNVKASNPVTEYSSDDAYNYTVGRAVSSRLFWFFCIVVPRRHKTRDWLQKRNLFVQKRRRRSPNRKSAYAKQHQPAGFALGRPAASEERFVPGKRWVATLIIIVPKNIVRDFKFVLTHEVGNYL